MTTFSFTLYHHQFKKVSFIRRRNMTNGKKTIVCDVEVSTKQLSNGDRSDLQKVIGRAVHHYACLLTR